MAEDYKSTADEDARPVARIAIDCPSCRGMQLPAGEICARCNGEGRITYTAQQPLTEHRPQFTLTPPDAPDQCRPASAGMTAAERALLLTVARILRVHLRDFHGIEYRCNISDLNAALAPFDATPGEPKNEANK